MMKIIIPVGNLNAKESAELIKKLRIQYNEELIIDSSVILPINMKKYYMYNFNETKEHFIGVFSSDAEFWEYYKINKDEIDKVQSLLDFTCKCWHMVGI